MISTRNIDNSVEYILIEKNVTAEAKMKQDDALQEAIDQAIRKFPQGEYMANVAVYVRGNGMEVRVIGDVWGTKKTAEQIAEEEKKNLSKQYQLGDGVAFRNSFGKIIQGKIIGLNARAAIIEVEKENGKKSTYEIKFEQLSRTL